MTFLNVDSKLSNGLVNRTSGFLREKFCKSGGVWIDVPPSPDPFKISAALGCRPMSYGFSLDRKNDDETKAIFFKDGLRFTSH